MHRKLSHSSSLLPSFCSFGYGIAKLYQTGGWGKRGVGEWGERELPMPHAQSLADSAKPSVR